MSDKSEKKMSLGTFRVLEVNKLLVAARDSGITKHADYNVLLQLILRCGPDKAFSCYPSYHQLELDTRLSPRQVKNSVASLKDQEVLKVMVRPHRSNTYFVQAKKIFELAAVRKASEKQEQDRYFAEYADV